MKLGMHSELTQPEIDNAKKPSDLYHALAKHHSDQTESSARFIYALRMLGHKRYGCRAVRELPGEFPAFDVAKLEVEKQHQFLFHQCLVIACRLLPRKCYHGFVAHFAKKLKVNPDNFDTPCSILTKSLKKGFITPDNQLDLLEEAFIKAELSENKIKEYAESCQELGKKTNSLYL